MTALNDDLIDQILQAIPDLPSEDLCKDKNPILWRLWCYAKGLPADQTPPWTEEFIVMSCDEMIEKAKNVKD